MGPTGFDNGLGAGPAGPLPLSVEPLDSPSAVDSREDPSHMDLQFLGFSAKILGLGFAVSNPYSCPLQED